LNEIYPSERCALRVLLLVGGIGSPDENGYAAQD
jgi:hypothetical protein